MTRQIYDIAIKLRAPLDEACTKINAKNPKQKKNIATGVWTCSPFLNASHQTSMFTLKLIKTYQNLAHVICQDLLRLFELSYSCKWSIRGIWNFTREQKDC